MIRRYAAMAGLVMLAGLMSGTTASARHRRHVRAPDRTPRQFVFQSPASADHAVFTGKFAGYMLPGLIGATTADPYERPGYGYYVGGGQGPGYFYDGP